MAIYLITYDLHKASGKKYDDIHEAITEFGDTWHYLDSTWLVDTNLTPKQMSTTLRKVYSDEIHLIIELDSTNYWGSLKKKAWDWIQSRIGYSIHGGKD